MEVAYYNRYNTRIAFQSPVEGLEVLTGAISTVVTTDLAANRVLVSNSAGKIAASSVTLTDLAQLANPADLTEDTSSVLAITGGAGALLGSGTTIQVKQASGAQGGYLSAADWTTFNNKLSGSLASGNFYVGNGSGVAASVTPTGDVTFNNSGVFAITASSIVNADVNASAAIVYSKLNLAGGIVNADINSAAAIARSKFASGTAYRILANDISGVMSENAALTASRAIGSDANGQLQSLTTTVTQVNYLSTTTSNVQDQFDNNILGIAASALAKAPTASEDGYAITWNDATGEWDLTDPIIQGLTAGGLTGQFLYKVTDADYDADWKSLTVADISDLSASADDLNVLEGADANGVTPDIISYLGGATPVTSSIQTQLSSKLNTSLSPGAIFYGNGSGTASQLSAATDGQVLTLVSGYPQWQTLTGTGTVTSVDVDGGTTGMSFTGGPVTTSGTITLTGTLDANNGGTGLAAYTVGDLLYADTTSTLAKLAIGTDGQLMTISSGLPVWDSVIDGGGA